MSVRTEFPDLSAAREIAVDVETCDPGLEAGRGPAVRSGGFIAGLAVGVPEQQWYFPMRHERGDNLDPEKVVAWAKTQLGQRRTVYGTNLIYDLDYLMSEGVRIPGPFIDVQIADPLIDENHLDYGLGAIAGRLGVGGKEEAQLYQWLAQEFGGPPTRRAQAGRIWRAPGDLVAPYACSDVRLPFAVHRAQRPLLAAQNLQRVWNLEMRLIPMMLAMRRRGVRVDLEEIERLKGVMTDRIALNVDRLEKMSGIKNFNTNSPIHMGKLCDKLGIQYALTPKSKKPSITKGFLATLDHPMARLVEDVRKNRTILDTFLNGHMSHCVNGRIHCEFHQMRRGADGTRSGRFSSANPNLQNIPSRDEELAPLIRGLFLPEPGEIWVSDDWSQIEYRFLVHDAVGPSGREAQQRYRENPDTDFHKMAHNVILERTGRDIGRKPTKNFNFGLVYGMGLGKTAISMGVSLETARELQDTYFEAAPFVRDTFDRWQKFAAAQGYVETIMGRRRRFPLWEARDWALRGELGASADRPAMLAAVTAAGGSRIQRAATHKALNARLQGSAADAMKKAMVEIWEAGICDVLGAPLLTVHDELDWSVPPTPEAEEAHAEAVRIMETCVELKVPLKVDSERGETWGAVK